MCNIVVGPDNCRPVYAIELLDPFAGVGRDDAERINAVGENAGQHLHAVVGGAGPVGVG